METPQAVKPNLKQFFKTDSEEVTTEPVAEEIVTPNESTEVEVVEEATSEPTAETNNEEVVNETTDSEGSEPWFSEEELGIIYTNEAEAKRGLVEKERYIRKLSDSVKELEKRANELESQISVTESKQGAEDTFEARVAEKLPEQFRGLSVEDITDESQLREYLDALADARSEVKTEDKINQLEQEREIEKRKEVRAQAQLHVGDKVRNFLSGLKNVEDRMAFEDVLETGVEVNGRNITPLAMAIMAYEVSPEYADFLLEGVYARHMAKRKESVGKYIRETKVEPRRQDAQPPPTNPSRPLHGRQAVIHSLSKLK